MPVLDKIPKFVQLLLLFCEHSKGLYSLWFHSIMETGKKPANLAFPVAPRHDFKKLRFRWKKT